MDAYKHNIQYYETDKMGITHHSNYIRWMEEARIDFMKQIGWPYEKMEEAGIISPVTAIECKYKASTTFPDEIEINVSIDELKPVILKISYLMRNKDGKIVFEGHSEHCFLNKDGKIIRIDREFPAFFEALQQQT
ncbi:MAG: acyl-CoA thioesterase [Lachnospiraceae bacterium]|nr:acyl-CoA thioesterase [Lachnospiraceae bacterium]